ncbi:hypothetical protein ACQPZX_33985 [Actinoplanes sp. CA-142083]|uniref:hypothetical protein n=1 Tax=Actinoplanes sp. CA-142083 TaxID=3239903 RepID=UPI003D9266C5
MAEREREAYGQLASAQQDLDRLLAGSETDADQGAGPSRQDRRRRGDRRRVDAQDGDRGAAPQPLRQRAGDEAGGRGELRLVELRGGGAAGAGVHRVGREI